MLCSHCSSPIHENYRYCPSCGATLPETDKNPFSPSQRAAPELPEDPKKRPMPLWFKVLASLTVLALVGVTAGILFTESLVDVIDDQLEALRKSDVSAAYQEYTSNEFRNTMSPDEFQKFIHAHPILTNNQSAHFTERSIQKHKGTIRGNLTSSDHVKVPVEYELVKENGQWKILSLRFPDTKAAPGEESMDHPDTQLD
jgi:hypothetical protein